MISLVRVILPEMRFLSIFISLKAQLLLNLKGLINVLEFQNTDSTGSVIFVNKQTKKKRMQIRMSYYERLRHYGLLVRAKREKCRSNMTVCRLISSTPVTLAIRELKAN